MASAQQSAGHTPLFKVTEAKFNVVTLLPIFAPAPGGGAEYARFLCERLPNINGVENVTAITERWPQEPRKLFIQAIGSNKRTTVERLLVRFYGLPKRTPYRFLAFACQNMQMLWRLWRLKYCDRRTVIIVHGAFFIHPSVLSPILRRLKAASGQKLSILLDVRDPSAPAKRLAKLDWIDGAITCGKRLTQRLNQYLPARVPVTEIPVPMHYYAINGDESRATLDNQGLLAGRYVLCPNGIKESKQFPLVFDTWQRLADQGLTLDLAVVGNTVDWQTRYNTDQRSFGRLLNLGPQSNHVTRILIKHAAAVVNPSRVEGLPRSSLESLSLGTPTLLPPGVPEFADLDRQFIADSDDPEQLAIQLADLIRYRRVAPYNLEHHAACQVAEDYARLLNQLSEPR